MEEAKAIIKEKISSKKVMVFSKPYCPYCKMAKGVLKKYVGKELNNGNYEVWEIDRAPNCYQLQQALKKMTGAQSVPRVFINGRCIGGGTETQDLEKRGQLAKMLRSTEQTQLKM
ncbi:uncharacterized protein LOC123565845 [Mercenaria mercenaria]|uniref:uncharacterized protein LOC123565845 n=1 Tax=Mercenaria mercenaria TaxID=6596 RepID=UPI00234F63C0|nr:uncharacterized protein LOC123565845 [Mercenaria mercenaria]